MPNTEKAASDVFQAKNLRELVGSRTMNYTPNTDIRHPFDPDCNGVAFEIDGVVYFCFEDGNDGYRSCAGPLMSYVGSPYEMGWYGSEYVKWPVVCSWREACEYGGAAEILEIRLVSNGQLILSVGTDNTDDYYPSFVAIYSPPLREEAQP